MRRTARRIMSAKSVRAAEPVRRQCPNLLTFVDGRELVSAQCPNLSRL